MDVAFFECWIQLAPHFSISFLFVYWCFPSTLCLLGMCFLGEALQKGCCWAHVEVNEDWTALVLVCFWWLGCWCEMLSVAGKLFGEGDGTRREGSDDGKAVCVCIIVQFFLSICFSLIIQKTWGSWKAWKVWNVFHDLLTAFKDWDGYWCEGICSSSVRYLTGLYLNMLKKCTAATEVPFECCGGIAQLKGNHAFKLQPRIRNKKVEIST